LSPPGPSTGLRRTPGAGLDTAPVASSPRSAGPAGPVEVEGWRRRSCVRTRGAGGRPECRA
jgi:hypothetical protein